MPDARSFSDEPIHESNEDLLGREVFVNELAQVFTTNKTDLSLVVALDAKWGEGKTSVVNLLCPHLEKSGFRVVRFNPWEWSSSADLTNMFLDEVGVALGGSSRRARDEVAKAWNRYAIRLKGSVQATFLLLPSVKLALLIVFLLSIPLYRISYWLLCVPVFIAIASWFTELIPALIKAFFPTDITNAPSLERLKADVRSKAKRAKRRLLFVLDDVDRLSPQETADVIRLVKANGDIPNISYLLVGDQAIIADHLSTALSVSGPAYLAKIVQLSVTLPAIEQDLVNKIFFVAADEMIAPGKIMKLWVQSRWGEIFQHGIEPSLRDLRSLKRFIATLDLHFRLLGGGDAFEANPVDLMGMEVIRVFHPRLHREIFENKDLYTSAPDKDKAFEAESRYSRSLSSAGISNDADVRNLLLALFPVIASFGQKGFSHGTDWKGWSTERRVCSPDFFDRYFMYRPHIGEITESDIEFFFEMRGRDEYVDRLAQYSREGKLEEALRKIRRRIKDIAKDAIPQMALAICDAGDALSHETSQMFSISSVSAALFTLDELLRRLRKDEIPLAFDAILRATSGLKLPIEYVRRLLGQRDEGRLDVPVSDALLTSWTRLLADRIAAKAEDQSFWAFGSSSLYLHLWGVWSSNDVVRDYVQRVTQSHRGAMQFLAGMIQTMHSSRPNKSGGSAHRYLRYSDIEKYVDPQDLYKTLNLIGDIAAETNLESQEGVVLFKQALLRHERGVNEDGFSDWMDDDDD